MFVDDLDEWGFDRISAGYARRTTCARRLR